MGDEIIKFGMENYRVGERYMEKTQKGFAKREFKRFAQTITFADIINELGGKDKLSAETYDMYQKMFNHIAGDDHKISANELKGYFKTLDKVAANDEMLSKAELEKMAKSRGELKENETVGFIFTLISTDKKGDIPKFIKTLISLNDKKLKQEDAKKAEKAEQEKNDISKTYDKNGNLIQKIYINKDKETCTDFYKNGKLVKQIRKNNSSIITDTFNKDGKVSERIYKSSESNYSSKTKYFYNENGDKTQEIETCTDAVTRTTTFDKNGAKKTIEKRADGSTLTSYWYNGLIFKPEKEIEIDSKGNKWITEYTYRDDYSEPNKIVKKDANNNIISTITNKLDKNGNVKESNQIQSDGFKEVTYYDNDGKPTRSVSMFKGIEKTIFYKNGHKVRQENLKNGVLESTYEYINDTNGNNIKEIHKDGQDNVTETTVYTKMDG